MVANYDQNSHQIRFWLLNNYKIEVMIEFSNQLTQNNNISYQSFSDLYHYIIN